MVVNKSKSAFRTIAEVADELGVATHVLRFWETKFPQIKPMKRTGGRRYYRPDDVELVRKIKDLLYEKRYTIEGVQKFIKEKGLKAFMGEEIMKDFFEEEAPQIELSGEAREIILSTINELSEISKELEVEPEEISFSLSAIQDPVSLQEPVFNDGTESIYIIDQVSDSKNTDEKWTESITIAEAMKKLSDKEEMIISKRFFDGRTQMEVAEEIGISQAQVSRIEKSAINHIKRLYN